MTTYFNQRTGDRVEVPGRSARLDSLDNWAIVEGSETPTIVNDGVLSRPTLTAPGVADPSADVPATNEELREENPAGVDEGPGQELTTTDDGIPKVPGRSASRSAWQAYARLVETDPERQSDIEGMTRDQLVDRYGSGGEG
ncbi:hypothetical protein AB0P02_01250 [Streptomyces griseoluteus]|uniref:hypothetical protein n=1 Tax=Streptomyces griseoluteus TaxID=29306 RepID=UPI00342B808A